MKPHPKAVANIHAPGEVDRPELVPFIVSDPSKLPGIVVDETAAELVGDWQYSTHTPPFIGLGYLHDMKAGKGTKSVTFTPDLPKAGRYEVRVAHCYNVRRATNTPVTIHHAGGDTLVRINQQEEPAMTGSFAVWASLNSPQGSPASYGSAPRAPIPPRWWWQMPSSFFPSQRPRPGHKRLELARSP
ncbi:hypothetical protein [Verrucomicrobium spinosum]|uniref:golvesin C-terminal-like domain-containing protein n=1 Tax=Verrucomicrobium spinosum TaxID=2736 RepID=UPI001C43BAB0|nr:hypothetical protein [Verrucomicrobium spinosum]